ncbi:MAG: regulatory protein RecX [Gemmatimonadota bacterium]|nr:MAG: regulatory protein RecX [Gemmatimonadota bacterium]
MDEKSRDDGTASDVSEEAARRAIDAALNFLSYRQRTGREVRRKLVERGFSADVIEAALARLAAVHLVDDEAFVGAYVRDRIAHRPMGVRRMIQELYQKGITREVALPVIQEVLREEETDERALAERVVEKKRHTLKSRTQDERVLRRRLRDHLIRRGFETRVANDVVDALFPRNDAEG